MVYDFNFSWFVTADQGSPDAMMSSWRERIDDDEFICDIRFEKGSYRLRVAKVIQDQYLEQPREFSYQSNLGKDVDLLGLEREYFRSLATLEGYRALLRAWRKDEKAHLGESSVLKLRGTVPDIKFTSGGLRSRDVDDEDMP